ncbi:MAG: T9SS type A sorting domain-containing protein, partial [Flavobacteriales bacterium]
SHGLISFRIRPRLTLLPGTTIENIANIYFDFNPPVITEPSVLVAEFSTGVEAQMISADLLLMPNPTNGSVMVQVSNMDHTVGTLNIRAVDGRLVKQLRMSSDRVELDLSALRAGAYWVEVVQSNGRVKGSKLLKY